MISKLETIPDKLLFKLFVPIAKRFKNEKEISSEIFDYYSSDLREEIFQRTKILGIDGDIDDLDFVSELLVLNFEKFKSEKLEGQLIRPQEKKYEVEYKVTMTEWATEYWAHKITSYSKENATNSMRYLEQNGNISYYDGRQTYRDVHDSETQDVELDDVKEINESIKKVSTIVEKSNKETLEKLKKIIEERISKA